jgi:glycerol-3-phosphate dehydrogenase
VVPSEAEIDYLCGVVSSYFRATIVTADVVWAYAGVRALHGDGASKPRDTGHDYRLVLDKGFGVAPLLTVYGGKLTTFRRLAEDALGKLAPFFVPAPPWTAQSTLPGGDIVHDGVASLVERTRAQWPFLRQNHAERLVGAYGTRVAQILQSAQRPEDLGAWLGADLTAAEVRYLMTREWAQTADDVLWRRSKLGLRLTPTERLDLERFMNAHGRALTPSMGDMRR